MPTPSSSLSLQQDSRVLRLESIERRLTDALTELRVLRVELGNESRDSGVLGSRGLTQFLIEHLHRDTNGENSRGWKISELMKLAEKAGYRVPTARTLSKRLVERRIRVGDILVDKAGLWWSNRDTYR